MPRDAIPPTPATSFAVKAALDEAQAAHLILMAFDSKPGMAWSQPPLMFTQGNLKTRSVNLAVLQKSHLSTVKRGDPPFELQVGSQQRDNLIGNTQTGNNHRINRVFQ